MSNFIQDRKKNIQGVIIGFNKTTKKLLIGILTVTILLGICISVDSADETITAKNNNTQLLKNISKNTTIINGTYQPNNGKAVSDGKIYTDKNIKENKPKKKTRKQNTITMTGRPSCTRCARNHIPYRWYTRTYQNYCPNCKHYNCLGNKHKSGSVHEQEITCFVCDSDFCIYDGKEKYSWSSVYLKTV